MASLEAGRVVNSESYHNIEGSSGPVGRASVGKKAALARQLQEMGYFDCGTISLSGVRVVVGVTVGGDDVARLPH